MSSLTRLPPRSKTVITVSGTLILPRNTTSWYATIGSICSLVQHSMYLLYTRPFPHPCEIVFLFFFWLKIYSRVWASDRDSTRYLLRVWPSVPFIIFVYVWSSRKLANLINPPSHNIDRVLIIFICRGNNRKRYSTYIFEVQFIQYLYIYCLCIGDLLRIRIARMLIVIGVRTVSSVLNCMVRCGTVRYRIVVKW